MTTGGIMSKGVRVDLVSLQSVTLHQRIIACLQLLTSLVKYPYFVSSVVGTSLTTDNRV